MRRADIPLFGLVLSGGLSTRMGQDKATLRYGEQPQLQRAAELLSTVCAATFVSARADQHDALRRRWPVIIDSPCCQGPLAGIVAAQQTRPDVDWLVLACDLPLLDEQTLRQLVAARTDEIDAIAFATDGHLEPLCALWQTSSAGVVAQASQAGERSPQRILTQLRTRSLTPFHPAALTNVNTPADYHRASAS